MSGKGLINSVVPYGTGGYQGPQIGLGGTIQGHRVWWGGDKPKLAYGNVKGESHEVLVPPGQCVYFWLGCERGQEVGNFCAPHAALNESDERADQASMAEVRREKKNRQRRKDYYAHQDQYLATLRQKRAQGATGGLAESA